VQVQVRVQGNLSTGGEAVGNAFVTTQGECVASSLAATVHPDNPELVDLDAWETCALWAQAPMYRFMVRAPGASEYTVLRDWNFDRTAQFWGATGSVDFRVDVRASWSGVETSAQTTALVGPACTAATLSGTYDGTTGVDLAAGATCPAPGAEYRFLGRAPNAWIWKELRAYSTAPTFRATVDPAIPGRWEFRAEVRRAGNASASEATVSKTVAVGGMCAGVSLDVSRVSGGIRVSATPQCSPAALRFLVRMPGSPLQAELQPYGPLTSLLFQPPTGVAGAYEFTAWARVAGNTSVYEATTTKVFLDGPTCSRVTLDASRSEDPSFVKLTAHPTCTPGSVPEVHFRFRPPGATAFVDLEPYQSPGVYWWQIPYAASGTYQFQVYARATGNASTYESQATVPVTLP
jgi:hypothetical protein